MDDREVAMNRVLDELSTLRKTLDVNERLVLDAIVVTSRVEKAYAAEVEPHAYKEQAKHDVGRFFAVDIGREDDRYKLKVT